MNELLIPAGETNATPLHPVRPDGLDAMIGKLPPTVGRWVADTGFKAETGSIALIPGADGGFERVLFGLGNGDASNDPSGDLRLWTWGRLPAALPEGAYAIADPVADGVDGFMAALGWLLGAYRFDRYRGQENPTKNMAALVCPEGCDRVGVLRAVTATHRVRDLINTPAADMGPSHLAAAAAALASEYGATCTVIEGDDLLVQNYPAIHAVGRAAADEPRLIDIVWGDDRAPKVTLVGKGVCFDTGGLDLKPANAMRTMKKDMGGAAHVLGLAEMVMSAGLPVRLRVLIPAVENSVAGNAMRPMDVVPTRQGISVEIGHTDAEGRVVLADALSEAILETPDMILDFATLTGAARVALGTDLPALFCNDDTLAGEIVSAGVNVADPVWRMPLWRPYRKQIDSPVADISNDSDGPYGGAIAAALFLQEFVGTGDDAIAWAHVDVMAWNPKSRPGRPQGGEALGMRAMFDMLSSRYS